MRNASVWERCGSSFRWVFGVPVFFQMICQSLVWKASISRPKENFVQGFGRVTTSPLIVPLLSKRVVLLHTHAVWRTGCLFKGGNDVVCRYFSVIITLSLPVPILHGVILILRHVFKGIILSSAHGRFSIGLLFRQSWVTRSRVGPSALTLRFDIGMTPLITRRRP